MGVASFPFRFGFCAGFFAAGALAGVVGFAPALLVTRAAGDLLRCGAAGEAAAGFCLSDFDVVLVGVADLRSEMGVRAVVGDLLRSCRGTPAAGAAGVGAGVVSARTPGERLRLRLRLPGRGRASSAWVADGPRIPGDRLRDRGTSVDEFHRRADEIIDVRSADVGLPERSGDCVEVGGELVADFVGNSSGFVAAKLFFTIILGWTIFDMFTQ